MENQFHSLNASSRMNNSKSQLQCSELLAESPPSTSSQQSTRSDGDLPRMTSADGRPPGRRRRPGRLTLANAQQSQGPVTVSSQNRKRQALDDALNRPQKPSVQPAPDATITEQRTLSNLLISEEVNQPIDYFAQVQDGAVTPKVREMAVDWLYDLTIEERCEVDIFPLAVSLLDRFLSVQPIFREHVQTAASVCLFLASKVKAPQPLNAKTIAYYTDSAVRVQEILTWELLVLSRLKWDVSTTTALDFFDQLAARAPRLRALQEDVLDTVRRIQRAEKLALLPASIQASICLLYVAKRKSSEAYLAEAEYVVFTYLNIKVPALYPYVALVDRTSRSPSPSSTQQLEEAVENGSPYQTPPINGALHKTVLITSPLTPAYSTDSGFESGASTPIDPAEIGQGDVRMTETKQTIAARMALRRRTTTAGGSGGVATAAISTGIQRSTITTTSAGRLPNTSVFVARQRFFSPPKQSKMMTTGRQPLRTSHATVTSASSSAAAAATFYSVAATEAEFLNFTNF